MVLNFWRTVGGLFLAACLMMPIFGFCAGDNKASLALSHYIMAVMHEDLGDLDKAIAEYKKALEADNRNSVVHLDLAVSYIKKSNFAEAVKELQSVINLDPEAIEPHAILALLYSTQDKPALAAGEYELALKNASKLEPKNIDIYRTLGVIYIQQKNFQSAENTYKLILDLAPNDPEAYFYLGTVYNELNQKDLSAKYIKKAIDLKPDFSEALNYLGYIYVEANKNLDQAERMIKKALVLEPDNGAYIDSLGWLYFKKGRFKEALKELEKADRLIEDSEIKGHIKAVKEKLNK